MYIPTLSSAWGSVFWGPGGKFLPGKGAAGFAALAHSPGGSLMTVVPRDLQVLASCGAGARPQPPHPVAARAALAASRKLLDLCIGLSALQTGTALPTRGWGSWGPMIRGGIVFPAVGKPASGEDRFPTQRASPEDGRRRSSCFQHASGRPEMKLREESPDKSPERCEQLLGPEGRAHGPTLHPARPGP